jgi:prepilin-type N-terminal cleavage/methylation domain-containing protein
MRPFRSRQGFTLIELLIVVVIIGILAAIAIPKFQNTKGKAFTASLKSDLKNVASMQEDFFYYNEQYSLTVAALAFVSTNGVTINIAEADARGWSATSTHPQAFPVTCAVFYGQAAPLGGATAEGVVHCQ